MLLKELYASFHSFHIIVEHLAGFSRSSSSRASDCHLHARGVSGPIWEDKSFMLFRSSQHEDSAGHKGTISALIGAIIFSLCWAELYQTKEAFSGCVLAEVSSMQRCLSTSKENQILGDSNSGLTSQNRLDSFWWQRTYFDRLICLCSTRWW